MAEAIIPTVGKPRFQVNVDVQILADLLKTKSVGEVATYEELSKAIGRNVQGRARYLLAAAKRRLLRDHRMVFDAVTNVGLKRLSDEECVGTHKRTTRAIRRMAERGIRVVAAARYETLSNASKVEHNVALAHLGAIAHVARSQQAKALKANVGGENPIPLAETLEAFKPK